MSGSSNQPVVALILGILGIFPCCGLCAPFAWYLGKKELGAISAGTSSAEGKGLATAGMVLGIIGTVLLVLTFGWIFLAGGMAVMQGLMGG